MCLDINAVDDASIENVNGNVVISTAENGSVFVNGTDILARIATLEDIVTSQSSLINTLLLRVNDANSSLALEANVDVFTCTLTFASGGPLFTGTFSAGDCGGHLPPTNDYIPVIVSGTIGNCWDYHRHDFSTLPNYKIESQSGPCEGPIVIIVKIFK